MNLNTRTHNVVQQICQQSAELRIGVTTGNSCTSLDFGVSSEGGLEAGLQLARLCLADLAQVSLVPGDSRLIDLPQVLVRTDHPVAACLQSQYAGWKIATDDFFAMGSGPMRSLARVEDLIREFPESPAEDVAVGILEASSLPTESAIAKIRTAIPQVNQLVLATAPTASQAGHVQVVARSVETAMHKLHELHFPLTAIISGMGTAPLPPVAAKDIEGIGRTNDSILYGGTVHLWVRCDDEQIKSIGEKVPSDSSASHGETFLRLFKAAKYDFYALDAALFSPAVVHFHNLKSGRTFSYGKYLPELLKSSFEL